MRNDNLSICALMTARGGSKSIPKKNIANVKGLPLYLHNVLHAKRSKYIDDVYITTDLDFIIQHADVYDYKTIDRPEYLRGDQASHFDTIIHGVEEIEKSINKRLDMVVVLLGNSIGGFTKDLDASIKLLIENSKADSVQSVSEFNMYNPFRAYKLDGNYLETVVPQEFIKNNSKHSVLSSRDVAGNVYFFNGSFWVIRRDVLDRRDGIEPFPWLGKKIIPYIQENYMEVDALWQLNYLQSKEWEGFS